MYLPATKLSNGTLSATVLTEGKVMVTQGLGMGQMMKLEDWLIIAEGVLPLNEKPPADTLPVDTPVESPDKNQKPAAKGSKFTWHLNLNNYRVAIVTAKGLLQVKTVIDGIASTTKKMFADEAAWRASLPTDADAITKLMSPDTRSSVQRRLEDPLVCQVSQSSNADKLSEYMRRFNIRTNVWEGPSPNSKVKNALDEIEVCRAELNKITIKDEMLGKIRHSLNLRLYKLLRVYTHMKSYASTTENPDKKPLKLETYGKSFLRTVINGVEYEVGVKSDRLTNSQIAVREASNPCKPVHLFNTFKEMGNPKFHILYRRRRYELTL